MHQLIAHQDPGVRPLGHEPDSGGHGKQLGRPGGVCSAQGEVDRGHAGFPFVRSWAYTPGHARVAFDRGGGTGGVRGTACADNGRRKASRQEKADKALSTIPVPRSYRFDGNELKVIEVPVKDGSGFVDSNRCYVWRDQEFKTASISCESRPEIALSDSN